MQYKVAKLNGTEYYRYTTFFKIKKKFAKHGFWNIILQICSPYTTDTLFRK